MFLKHIKHIVALMVISGVLFGAAGASASTVTVSPSGPVTGTGGWVQFVFNTAGKTIVCTGSSYTATYNAGGTGVTLPFSVSTNFQFAFTGCRLNNGAAVTIACSATASLKVTGATASGATPMTLTGISCVITVTGSTCSVRLTGGVVVSHDNTSHKLTILTTGQTLVASGSTSGGGGGTCTLLPNDASVSLLDSRTGGAATFVESPATTITAT